jgi:transcriptional regulator with XRE-family HTH domain
MDKINNTEFKNRYASTIKKLGSNISFVRHKKNLSLKTLSTSSHYDSDLISYLESGLGNIQLDKLLSLSKALDVDFKFLFNSKISESTEIPHFIEDDYLLVFVNNIQQFLLRKGKNKQSLCVYSGLSPSAISRLLNGTTKNPTILTLLRISEALEISINKLFERSYL